MDMLINSELIISERKRKAWSQQRLAEVSGLSLRTVQRIEKTQACSPESLQALCAVFNKQPSFFQIEKKQSNSIKLYRKISAGIALAFIVVISLLNFSPAVAESVTLKIDFNAEFYESDDKYQSTWTVKIEAGDDLQLALPSQMVLHLIPKTHHEDKLLDVTLSKSDGKPLIDGYEKPTTVTKNLFEPIIIRHDEQGRVKLYIRIEAVDA